MSSSRRSSPHGTSSSVVEQQQSRFPQSRHGQSMAVSSRSGIAKDRKRKHADPSYGSSDEEEVLIFQKRKSKLSKMAKYQSTRVRKRLPSRSVARKGKKKGRKHREESCSSESSDDDKDIEESWGLTLAPLPRSFFSKKSAQELYSCGSSPFKGVTLSTENSCNLKTIYDVTSSAYGSLGDERSLFKGLRSVLGQFVRFLCFHGCISGKKMRTLWKERNLFSNLANFDAVKVFIGHFQEHNAVSTVAFKANVLLSFFDYAESHLRRNGANEENDEARKIFDFLRQTRNSYKTKARKVTHARKCTSVRNLLLTRLLPADFVRFSSEAQEDLSGLMTIFAREVRKSTTKKKTEKLFKYYSRNPRVLQKWCINLIAALVLNGEGQRPQAYVQLQCPSMSRLRQIGTEMESTGYFSLRTLHEKRMRDAGLPEVIIPASLFSAICFHVEYVRPYLLDEDFGEGMPLLIDTREGKALKEKAITRTIRAFLKRRDLELSWVTMANIRSSYATMAITKHREGNFFQDMDERSLVDFLAKVMNTSTEMISRTYAAADQDTVQETAAKMARLVQEMNETDEEENIEEEESENEDDENDVRRPIPHKRFEL